MEHHPEDMRAAEEYLQAHGRTGGSSLATIDAFLAGASHVRTSAEWKAMEAVIVITERYTNYSCTEWETYNILDVPYRDHVEECRLCKLQEALIELDRIRGGGTDERL